MSDFLITINNIGEIQPIINFTDKINDEIKNITIECANIDKKINNIITNDIKK